MESNMKKIFVLMMVKNEIDIIENNIRYLQTQDIDYFYIADNMSTDGTRQVLSELQKEYENIHIIDDNIIGYYQSIKMNKWARDCFNDGADIVIPIDADEVWYSLNNEITLGNAIRASDAEIFVAKSTDYIPKDTDDMFEENFIKRIINKKSNSDSFSSVAFSCRENFGLEMGNHNVNNHDGKRVDDIIGIRHYQYRSYDQFVNKVKQGKEAYDHTHFPDYMGSHWRKLGSMTEDELRTYWGNYTMAPTEEDIFKACNYD
jgi:hypothetical protein